MLNRKDELIDIIIGAIGHEHKGQKSYDHGLYKIEVKTPFIYSLDTKKYKSGEIKLPDNFNPIKESVSYSVDKNLCDEYMESAPKKVREALIELIDEKPGKKNVVLTRKCR